MSANNLAEKKRVETLNAFKVLDTEETTEFDNLVKLAAQICGMPIAKINFLDEKRVWSKANYGNDLKESPRENSFCHTTINEDEFMVVEDLSKDNRFRNFQLVTDDPKIRFYAGVNITKERQNIGTICVLGLEPKQLSESQLSALKTLGKEIEARLELSRSKEELENTLGFLSASVDLMFKIDPETLKLEYFSKNEGNLLSEIIPNNFSDSLEGLLPEWDFLDQLKRSYSSQKKYLKVNSKIKYGEKEAYLEMNAVVKNDKWLITAKDITKRIEAEQQINKERLFTEAIINSLPVNFFIYDEEDNLLKWTENNFKNGYSDEEYRKLTPLDFFDGDDRNRMKNYISQILKNNENQGSIEADLIQKDGTKMPSIFNAICFEREGKKYLVGTSQSIANQKKDQEKLEALLKEKEVLLGEVHHRVKNNLAVISGLLQMQEFMVDDPRTKSVLLSNQMRVKSMALIHEELYQANNFASIRFDKYLNQLLNFVKDKRSDGKKDIRLKSKVESFEMNLNQAVPLALIINELVSNAYEFAFQGLEKGEIVIKLYKESGEIKLTIQDNGIGLPEGFVLEESPTLGTTLILSYSEQINSEIKIDSGPDKGTLYKLAFAENLELKGTVSNTIFNESQYSNTFQG